MTWKTRMRPVPTDPTHEQPVLLPRQNCHDCGKALTDPFKSAPRDADTWIWTECYRCMEPICTDCSDEDGEGPPSL